MNRAQHEQTCVHANNTPGTFLCLRSEPNECTRFNQSIHREHSVASYAYEHYSRYPSSNSQPCQLGELAEGLDTARELVVIQVPECALCATWANVCARQQHPSHIPCLRSEPNECTRFHQSMHRERSVILSMPTTDIHASPPLTHKIARLVSLPRASTSPDNLLSFTNLNVGCA